MAGDEISDLELQPKYPIVVAGRAICTYRGDFAYLRNGEKRITCEDVKGFKTPVYNLKIKLVKALYPHVNFVEVQGNAR